MILLRFGNTLIFANIDLHYMSKKERSPMHFHNMIDELLHRHLQL